MENEFGNIVAPAAVFYLGFDGMSSKKSNIGTGTAFFREKQSGLERLTSIQGNETKFCKEFPESIACIGDESNDDDSTRFEETFRVVGKMRTWTGSKHELSICMPKTCSSKTEGPPQLCF